MFFSGKLDQRFSCICMLLLLLQLRQLLLQLPLLLLPLLLEVPFISEHHHENGHGPVTNM